MEQRGMPQQGRMQPMQQKGQTTQDATLKEKINDKLTNVWFSKAYENLDIQVSNNTVTIRGTVDTDKDKAEVERRVRSIPEVKDVRLQLTIKNSGGDTRKGQDQRSGSTSQSY
jgi:osmotically-inducible protein OsmY